MGRRAQRHPRALFYGSYSAVFVESDSRSVTPDKSDYRPFEVLLHLSG